MQYYLKANKYVESRLSYLLPIALLCLTAVSAIFISYSRESIGVLFIAGIFVVAIVVLTLSFPIFGFYFCFILSFFIFDLIRFFDTDLPVVVILDLMAYLTFMGVLINKVVKKEPFWKNCRSPIVVLYVIILLYFIFEFFNPNGGNNELYFLTIRRFVALLLFFYCAIQLFKDYKSIKRFFITILALAVIVGLYACYQQWIGLPKYELDAMYKDPNTQPLVLFYLALGSLRKASFLSDCSAYGLLMSGTSIVALTLFMKLKTSVINKLLLAFAAILLPVAMSFSGTRTATIMLIAQIGLFILMTINEGKTILFAGCFILLFIAVMIAPTYGNQVIPRLRSTFDFEDASLNVRNVNRHDIQPYIYSHPIGGGVRTSGVIYEKYNIGHPLAGFPTDSGLLSMALDVGWIGLLLQCIAYFIVVQQGIRAYYKSRNPTYKALLLAATLCVFGYIVAEYSQVAVGQIPGAFVIYGLIAVIIRLPQLEASPTPAQNINRKI